MWEHHKSQWVIWLLLYVLNKRLRPFLTKWHPLLQAWEVKRLSEQNSFEHEQQWSEKAKLRTELEKLRQGLKQYADA